jgi:hypothetical protein
MGAKEEAEERAERLEREARDAIAEGRKEHGIGLAREALAIRQAFQVEGHRDLIWPLSLCISALGDPDSALEAARLGERRLVLRRVALADAPDELACSLRGLIDLYRLEGQELLDARRVEELRRELAALTETGGAAGQEV